MSRDESEFALPVPAVVEPPTIHEEQHDDALEPSNPTEQGPPTLSKNARKRLLKEARFAEKKAAWKRRDKELKKDKQRMKAEKKRAAAEDGTEAEPITKKQRLNTITPFNARVVVDLGFDDKMSDKEIKSLCNQLGYAYASNRKSSTPFISLAFSSLNGRTKQRLDELGNGAYLRWKSTERWEGGYETLWEGDDVNTEDGAPLIEDAKSDPQVETSLDSSSRVSVLPPMTKQSVVYLSADSPNEIGELLEGETYIIGGIVDKNRYKWLCQNKAEAQGVRTAKLPIGKYLSQMQTRKVLTVNQVFDILLQWVEFRDWEAAITSVMPKRKLNQSGEALLQGHEDAEQDHQDNDEDLDLASALGKAEAEVAKD